MNLATMSTRVLESKAVRGALSFGRGVRRQCQRSLPGEPPFERGRVPFLGCAIDYGKDPAGFLAEMRRRHGDVFTTFIAGDRMTFILDPIEYPTVLLDQRLDFHELAGEISARSFGHSVESLALLDNDAVRRLTIHSLRGQGLEEMTLRVQEKLAEQLADAVAAPASGLYELISRVVTHASSDALFGDGFADEEVWRDFNTLDKRFPLLVAGVPTGLLSGVEAARRALHRRFAEDYANAAALIVGRNTMFRGVVDEHERQAYQLALMWAAVANTIPATFWALFYIARDPTTRDAIVAEIRSVLADVERRTESGGPLWDRSALAKMVLLDSAIDETLRLTSGSLVIRVARDPMILTLSSGREVPLRRGDRVALYPYTTHHDPEIYDAPSTFRADRFLDDGGRRRVFARRGEKLRHHLMPFGGGVSMCPGRHFARNEIKLATAMVLGDYDLELLESALPELDRSRAGLGILPPVSDVRYSLSHRT